MAIQAGFVGIKTHTYQQLHGIALCKRAELAYD